MKIGFDAKKAFESQEGLGNYSKFIIRALSENHQDHDYLLYTPKLVMHQEAKTMLAPENVHVRTPSKVISKMNLSSIWHSTILANTAVKDGIDIFHGLFNELPLVTNRKLKTVVSVHDVLPFIHPEVYSILDLEIMRRRIKHACQVADRIIAVNSQIANDLQEYLHIAPQKIEVINQGCDPGFHKEYAPLELNKIIDKYRLPQDYMLNVDSASTWHNTLLILQAMELEPNLDIPLVIIGEDSFYKKTLLKFARDKGLSSKVIFLHHVEKEDLPKLYQLAKVFVYPPKVELGCLPIIEALCSKVPVITTKGTCFFEAGGPASIYINPDDPEELAEAIMGVISNASIAGKMILKGESYACQYSEKKIANELMFLYKKLVV